jgi:hypothetical protein
MGISTRKAGTVVKCPKCAGEIIVPSPDEPQTSDEPAEQAIAPPVEQPGAAPAGPAAPFEEKDFEAYFNEAANGSIGATAPARTETAPPESVPESAAVPPPPPPPARRGLFLTLGALIFSIIVILLLLILVFVLGVVIGKQMAPRDTAASTHLQSVANRHNCKCRHITFLCCTSSVKFWQQT